MKIVIASSEAVPFAKTGGLADVASALSKALAQRGHDVSLMIPHYPRELAKRGLPDPEPTGLDLEIEVGRKGVGGRVLRSSLPHSNVTVFHIDQPDYFDRPGLYVDEGGDFRDNCERFSFFSRAVLETVRRFDLRPDVLHANDWQTGLLPALLKTEYQALPGFEHTSAVFTIHNMAFQGQFWHWDMLLTGMDWKYFNWRQMEFFGYLNLLKTGVVFADIITTVSPTYAREIQTPEYGFGLNGVLYGRRDDLLGILNGVDTEIWNPAIDPNLPMRYDADHAGEGKALCKAELQQRLGLPVRPDVPLFGMISRMTDQKGLDLIAGCIQLVLGLDVQLAFLGTGEARYEQMLRQLALQSPGKVSATIGFDEPLAHLIEAGADVYLMPSQFEPCGLNQMYSLIYGTVPIVRSVGGLADSVVDATEANFANGTANGFSFHDYRSAALFRQICRAVGLYHDKQSWHQLMRNGMTHDWSWQRSADQYLDVYHRATSRRHAHLAPA